VRSPSIGGAASSGAADRSPAAHGAANRDETGAGLLATMLGLMFFVSFLLVGLQMAADLYWQSQMRLVAFDAARVAAEAGGSQGQGNVLVAGLLGQHARTAWTSSPDEVRLTLTAPRSRLLVAPWRSGEHTVAVTVHREGFRLRAAP